MRPPPLVCWAFGGCAIKRAAFFRLSLGMLPGLLNSILSGYYNVSGHVIWANAIILLRVFLMTGMEGVRYKAGSINLSPGDKVFLYTDGVTEAANGDNELYGRQRLDDILNRNAALPATELLPAVKAEIAAFVGEAPQFDDITVLCMEYQEVMSDD